jgi:predicted N-formylglutamate amidohydrolase
MLDKTEMALEDRQTVLAADDPPPFEVVNAEGAAALLFTCDHASRALPSAYGGLGLDDTELRRHIAWDIGAADLARRLSARLDAPAVLAGYSRLFVDCNRALDDPTSIVKISDGAVVPGNRHVDAGEAARRADAVFRPYHDAIADVSARFAARGVVPALISVHSFSPVLGGIERPWHAGVLWDRDPRLAVPLLAALRADPALVVGDNEPYSGRLNYGYSIEAHGARPGLPQVLIEVRQDLVDTHHGAEAWCERLAVIFERLVADAGGFEIVED